MRKRTIYFTLVLVLSINIVTIGQTDDYYDLYINRVEQSYPIEKVRSELALVEHISPSDRDITQVIKKMILLFRRATFLENEEEVKEASDFVSAVYDSNLEQQIPIMLAYKGVTRTMIAGSLKSSNPIPKVQLLDEGKQLIDESIETLKRTNSKDNLTLGFIYFLSGKSFSSVPSFLKISKEAPKNLKKALSLYKKVKGASPTLIANVFYAYGTYYQNKGNVRVAIKNLNIAKKYAKDNALLYSEIDTLIEEIRKE